jgi:hypothetical protein
MLCRIREGLERSSTGLMRQKALGWVREHGFEHGGARTMHRRSDPTRAVFSSSSLDPVLCFQEISVQDNLQLSFATSGL